ncbi:MAG: hypothetical protein KAR42_04575 [candidate division Zixibacteria bacterium]|nr:hypothetical protein [candidate division Zixibacteria bacterium]
MSLFFRERNTQAGNQQGNQQGNRSGSRNQLNKGQGRGLGPGGNCVCPSCGATAPHSRGVPCSEAKCPQCGSPMVRE